MPKAYDIGDTIVAISTPRGLGGVGIVRLSGPDALNIADQMFKTRKGIRPSECATYTVHYGDVIKQGEAVDEALLTVMKAPKSYTCEDVVEISCHGGSAAVNTVFQIALELGARVAAPGEFTKRAFLNGRIDLTQAEAVLDIIQAKTEAGLSVSEHQLKGELTQCLEGIRQQLMDLYVQIEGAVNFPEEEEAPLKIKEMEVLNQVLQKIEELLLTADQGRIVREGIKVVLCGKPNVGKSSLMNVLLRQPRAIVSQIEGTTRDAVEETAQIGGVPFQMVDTAGILSPRDEIEEEAVKRSRLHIEDADLVLLLLDGSAHLNEQDLALANGLEGKNVLVVVNKLDLEHELPQSEISALLSGRDILKISARTQEGIQQLRDAILKNILHGEKFEPDNVVLSNIRHIDLLKKCLSELQSVIQNPDNTPSLEFISEHIKQAVHQLDRITGRDADSDLVDQIFSEFCIGK